ncbi:unnamed protein product, partial [Discosporangium mesarthrocarpum]
MFQPFPSPFQSAPADLFTVFFARRRAAALGEICARVEAGGAPGINRETWERHYGQPCTGL